MTTKATEADYGIDAPGVVLRLAIIGGAFVLAGIAARMVFAGQPSLAGSLLVTGVATGTPMLLSAAVMVWSSRVGKLRMRDRLLDPFGWTGTERVLDVGCGRGLLLVGAAKRLPDGKAIGVDIWQAVDQSGNSPEATRRNAHAEEVDGRVELTNGDAARLPLASETFDSVVSSFVLHNIHDRASRERAVREIVRVLKPGGSLALVDIAHTGEYARVLADAGMTEVSRSFPTPLFMLPTRTVRARKPRRGG